VLCGATWEPGRLVTLDAFRAERLQLLAEADHRYRQGELWWLHEPDLMQAHEESLITRVDGGPLFESVAQALQSMVAEGEMPTFKSICNRMGLLSVRELTLSVQRHVGRALTLLGWRAVRRREAGSRETYYERIPS